MTQQKQTRGTPAPTDPEVEKALQALVEGEMGRVDSLVSKNVPLDS